MAVSVSSATSDFHSPPMTISSEISTPRHESVRHVPVSVRSSRRVSRNQLYKEVYQPNLAHAMLTELYEFEHWTAPIPSAPSQKETVELLTTCHVPCIRDMVKRRKVSIPSNMRKKAGKIRVLVSTLCCVEVPIA